MLYIHVTKKTPFFCMKSSKNIAIKKEKPGQHHLF